MASHHVSSGNNIILQLNHKILFYFLYSKSAKTGQFNNILVETPKGWKIYLGVLELAATVDAILHWSTELRWYLYYHIYVRTQISNYSFSFFRPKNDLEMLCARASVKLFAERTYPGMRKRLEKKKKLQEKKSATKKK